MGSGLSFLSYLSVFQVILLAYFSIFIVVISIAFFMQTDQSGSCNCPCCNAHLLVLLQEKVDMRTNGECPECHAPLFLWSPDSDG